MATNRSYWFRVIVGDEERQFRGVGVAAEGLYCKLRRWAHDAGQVGFLVDHRMEAIDFGDLADLLHVRPGEFRAHIRELRERQIVQSAGEFRAALSEASGRNRRAKRMLAILDDMLAQIVALSEVERLSILVVPPLVSQHLETMYGKTTGRAGAPGARAESESAVTSLPPQPPPPPSGGTVGEEGGGGSEIRNQKSEIRKESKRKTTTRARAEGPADEGDPGAAVEPMAGPMAGSATDPPERPKRAAPWSWEKHLFLCDQKRKLDARLARTHPEALEDGQLYASHFFGEFGFEGHVFVAAQEFYQDGPGSTAPPACDAGTHDFDPETNYCTGCGQRFEELSAAM